MMGKLTAVAIKAISKPGLHGDGGGLYLRIAAGGSRQWMLRVTIDGRRRDMGLGSASTVSLANAREAAAKMRTAVAEGRDPLAEKRKAKMPTFEEAAGKVHAANLPRWRNAKHARQWIATLTQYAFPIIGNKPMDKIGREDVLRVLEPIWQARPETARRTRQRIKTVFADAVGRGHIEFNPVDLVSGVLPSLPRGQRRMAALPWQAIPETLAAIDGAQGWPPAILCLRFIVLTATRSGEARGATWDEIDPDAATWVIRAARMKMGKPHRVPLSDAALAMVDAARPYARQGGLIFPASRGGTLKDEMLLRLLKTVADGATVHGLRSSFRDWCSETGKPREVAEAALAHTVGGVEGAYFRSDLFEARRRLMADWARFLDGGKAKVVRLHG